MPLELLNGWIKVVSKVNPITFILEAGRGLLAGSPTEVALAFGLGAALILIMIPWALFGLRRAEKAG